MIFSWWNSATLGTWLLTTWLHGEPVGTDDFGNRYYQNKDGSRRWVIYNGTVEASRVPPDWHGWLHHTYAEPPTQAPFKTRRLREAAPAQPDRHRRRLSSRAAACTRAACGRPPPATIRPGSRIMSTPP